MKGIHLRYSAFGHLFQFYLKRTIKVYLRQESLGDHEKSLRLELEDQKRLLEYCSLFPWWYEE